MKEIDNKANILEIALRIFIRKGYQGASLNEIARQAGLTKGGIYHYFKSKDDLYYQALMNYFNAMFEKLFENYWLQLKI